jgi:hypothetical protein
MTGGLDRLDLGFFLLTNGSDDNRPCGANRLPFKDQGPSRTAYTLLPSAIEQFFQNR